MEVFIIILSIIASLLGIIGFIFSVIKKKPKKSVVNTTTMEETKETIKRTIIKETIETIVTRKKKIKI